MIRTPNVLVAKLAIYFGGQPDGQVIPWGKIQDETEIQMDYAGRALARRGARMARREYIAHKGKGLELSAPGTALRIVGSRLERVGSALRRTDRTHANLAARHYTEMAAKDQAKMLQLAGFLGAIKAMQREATVKIVVEHEAALAEVTNER